MKKSNGSGWFRLWTERASISFHFVYSPADQYRPSQGCHLFNVAQSFHFLLYLVIGKSCRDEAFSYFVFFFHLVFLHLNVLVKFSFCHFFSYMLFFLFVCFDHRPFTPASTPKGMDFCVHVRLYSRLKGSRAPSSGSFSPVKTDTNTVLQNHLCL